LGKDKLGMNRMKTCSSMDEAEKEFFPETHKRKMREKETVGEKVKRWIKEAKQEIEILAQNGHHRGGGYQPNRSSTVPKPPKSGTGESSRISREK
jgi:hypothetical protein